MRWWYNVIWLDLTDFYTANNHLRGGRAAKEQVNAIYQQASSLPAELIKEAFGTQTWKQIKSYFLAGRLWRVTVWLRLRLGYRQPENMAKWRISAPILLWVSTQHNTKQHNTRPLTSWPPVCLCINTHSFHTVHVHKHPPPLQHHIPSSLAIDSHCVLTQPTIHRLLFHYLPGLMLSLEGF